jgi:predicted porin
LKTGLAASVLLAVTGIAHAQSSVTLYGRMDNGFQYQSGLARGSQVGLETGNWAPSEFGLKGSEDLGNGTKAIFTLEAGLDTLNGASMGTLFDRQATVGVTNDRWGTFKLGNLGIYEINEDSFDVDPQVFQIWSLSTLVRGRDWSTAGNGLEYTSPELVGVTLKGQYDLTNSTTWNAGNPGSGPGQLGGAQGRSDGLEAQYDGGPLQLIAIYDEIRDPYGQFSNVYVASRSILAGGSYNLGPVKFVVGYQHLSAPNASDEGYFGAGTPTAQPAGVALPTAVDQEWLGATWQASALTSLTGAIYHTNANRGNGNATLYTVAGTYNLSKRTFLYAEVAWLHNSATSNLGLGGGTYGANINNDPVNGSVDNGNPDYGHGQFGATTGIVMQF